MLVRTLPLLAMDLQNEKEYRWNEDKYNYYYYKDPSVPSHKRLKLNSFYTELKPFRLNTGDMKLKSEIVFWLTNAHDADGVWNQDRCLHIIRLTLKTSIFIEHRQTTTEWKRSTRCAFSLEICYSSLLHCYGKWTEVVFFKEGFDSFPVWYSRSNGDGRHFPLDQLRHLRHLWNGE